MPHKFTTIFFPLNALKLRVHPEKSFFDLKKFLDCFYILIIWEGIGFMWKMTFEIFIKSLRFETPRVRKNSLLHKDLQVWFAKFFHKMYIFLFNSKKYYWKSKIQFFNNSMWNTKKTQVCKIVCFNKIYKFCLTYFLIKRIFFILIKKIRLKFKNSIIQTKYVRYEKNVEMENYLSKWGLQILSRIFFDKMYIFCFSFKKTILIIKNSIF